MGRLENVLVCRRGGSGGAGVRARAGGAARAGRRRVGARAGRGAQPARGRRAPAARAPARAHRSAAQTLATDRILYVKIRYLYSRLSALDAIYSKIRLTYTYSQLYTTPQIQFCGEISNTVQNSGI